ncbi:MAG: hypothetical protein IJ171_05685, partial [Ruminococcus sp.]|nr:hypothetical protein [Ruminococcus sp.]
VPMVTDGSYFSFKKRAHVVIGKPINPLDVVDPNLSDKENIVLLTRVMRERIIDLGNMLHERTKEEV